MPMSSLSGDGLLSMTFEEDYVNANAGSPVDGTWYTVTDYDGKGKLFGLGIQMETTTNTGEFRITLDGNAHAMAKASVNKLYNMRLSAANYFYVDLNLEFTQSLLVEVRRDGDTNAIHGLSMYGILSEEFKREIILAGNPLPGRNYTYPFDVMVIWFQGDHGVSNKIQFLPGTDKVDITYDKNGKPSGELLEPTLNDTLGEDRFKWVRSYKDTTVDVILKDGTTHAVPVINGAINNTLLPVVK